MSVIIISLRVTPLVYTHGRKTKHYFQIKLKKCKTKCFKSSWRFYKYNTRSNIYHHLSFQLEPRRVGFSFWRFFLATGRLEGSRTSENETSNERSNATRSQPGDLDDIDRCWNIISSWLHRYRRDRWKFKSLAAGRWSLSQV